ncbi:hypothetical protein CBR_g74255 [Chara braunii]|uniref:Uncharacterized protein n=1 Tax=Chara braunii TaxID=69332 RepID=A0A388JJ73_CHABU|nr:hypothetical protein CBR_g74255 [Chara braunii]|eukprot:GBG41325.1 hypothetical protein CBR_g74255 [Chara braunii]
MEGEVGVRSVGWEWGGDRGKEGVEIEEAGRKGGVCNASAGVNHWENQDLEERLRALRVTPATSPMCVAEWSTSSSSSSSSPESLVNGGARIIDCGGAAAAGGGGEAPLLPTVSVSQPPSVSSVRVLLAKPCDGGGGGGGGGGGVGAAGSVVGDGAVQVVKGLLLHDNRRGGEGVTGRRKEVGGDSSIPMAAVGAGSTGLKVEVETNALSLDGALLASFGSAEGGADDSGSGASGFNGSGDGRNNGVVSKEDQVDSFLREALQNPRDRLKSKNDSYTLYVMALSLLALECGFLACDCDACW